MAVIVVWSALALPPRDDGLSPIFKLFLFNFQELFSRKANGIQSKVTGLLI